MVVFVDLTASILTFILHQGGMMIGNALADDDDCGGGDDGGGE